VIRGYFVRAGNAKRPFVNGLVELPEQGFSLTVAFLVDTGADRTLLSPRELMDVGFTPEALATLERGDPTSGVGGAVHTRMIEAQLTLGRHSRRLVLGVLLGSTAYELVPTIPSVLGSDVLSRFAVLVDARNDRVLLLEPEEADALPVPF
jgi:predicted aspartyl protease